VRAALQSVIRLAFSIALLSSIVGCATTLNLRVEDPGDVARFRTWDWLRDDGERVHVPADRDSELQVYFCDPSSPWQRGTNENTNRLLRQYFPKGTDLSGYSQADLNRVALQLNQRPRKTLAFHCPAEVLNDNVALTA
jgi:hypothetical protein